MANFEAQTNHNHLVNSYCLSNLAQPEVFRYIENPVISDQVEKFDNHEVNNRLSPFFGSSVNADDPRERLLDAHFSGGRSKGHGGPVIEMVLMTAAAFKHGSEYGLEVRTRNEDNCWYLELCCGGDLELFFKSMSNLKPLFQWYDSLSPEIKANFIFRLVIS